VEIAWNKIKFPLNPKPCSTLDDPFKIDKPHKAFLKSLESLYLEDVKSRNLHVDDGMTMQCFVCCRFIGSRKFKQQLPRFHFSLFSSPSHSLRAGYSVLS
jgi:hypothetical protein